MKDIAGKILELFVKLLYGVMVFWFFKSILFG